MKLTQQQNSVFQQIKAFMESDAPVFILRGYAGTGKTTMVKVIADYLEQKKHLVLMAPTGRAVRVLHEKTKKQAYTIHKAIYGTAWIKVKKVSDVADSEYKLVFPIVKNDSPGNIVCIVDEASMVCSRTIEQELFSFGTDNVMDDLLTFVRPNFGGKVIFVGDPAQLPPVGESKSNALNPEFFSEKGLKVFEAELTEVLRQNDQSLILKNAMMIRDLLKVEKRNRLVFEERAGDVETLKPEDILTQYMDCRKESGKDDSVVICFSNRSASAYNWEIRRLMFGADVPIRVGDRLMITQNNYKLGRMNGEFVRVLSVGERVQQKARVSVQAGGEKKQVVVTLNFVQIEIPDDLGTPVKCLLLEDLLNNDSASLSIDESRALFINFCMRNPNLKQDDLAFAEALVNDVYYNAIRAKYGYAVTGHKCQGGEWEKVFVDYTGRTGLSDDCLRWAYTATTRAQKTLYVTNLPHITPFSKFRIDPIGGCKKMDAECRITDDVPETPFHSLQTANYLRAKYQCIVKNMEGTPYSVASVQSSQYLETYLIQTPDGVVRFDIYYKAGGVFSPAKPVNPNAHAEVVKSMLDDERAYPYKFDYHPSDEVHERLYTLIRSACDGLSIQMTNVKEHPGDFSVIYYLRTSGVFSYIKAYIDGKGFVTYAKPMSMAGASDHELQILVNEIKNHFTD